MTEAAQHGSGSAGSPGKATGESEGVTSDETPDGRIAEGEAQERTTDRSQMSPAGEGGKTQADRSRSKVRVLGQEITEGIAVLSIAVLAATGAVNGRITVVIIGSIALGRRLTNSPGRM